MEKVIVLHPWTVKCGTHLSPHWTRFLHGLGTCRPRDPGSSCCLPPNPALVLTKSGVPGFCASADLGTVSEETHKYKHESMKLTKR